MLVKFTISTSSRRRTRRMLIPKIDECQQTHSLAANLFKFGVWDVRPSPPCLRTMVIWARVACVTKNNCVSYVSVDRQIQTRSARQNQMFCYWSGNWALIHLIVCSLADLTI